MGLRKNTPIDLNCEYPCPCRRNGRLKPIILTEAMGCDKCQQIFVLAENKEYIEQLNPIYPYKKRWRWIGKRWINAQKPWQESYFLLGILCFFFSILVTIPLLITLTGGLNLISGIMVGLVFLSVCFSWWFVSNRF